MTTYTPIANSEIDQDSPVTQPLMTALRDNPIAIAEGASGAPQIQTAAIQDAAVTTAKINNALRSFSGTIAAGATVDITLSDSYAFAPIFSAGSTEVSLRFRNGAAGYTIASVSGVSRTYSLSWRYIAV